MSTHKNKAVGIYRYALSALNSLQRVLVVINSSLFNTYLKVMPFAFNIIIN